MASSRPVATYALRIPPGDILIPAVPEFAPSFRITMAAIDPTEDIDIDAAEDKVKPRATLKIVRVPDMDDDDEDDEDEDDLDLDEDDEDEELNGGPSVKKSKKSLVNGAADEDSDESMDEADIANAIKKIMSKSKGKSKAADDEEDDDDEDMDEDDSDDDEALSMDECVLCTLDTERTLQQPLDFHIAEGERVFFKVSGNLTVHLTGNYVMSLDDESDDEEGEYDEDEYDLSPDEDELDGLDALLDGEESDDLDDIDDPRITEIEEEEKPKVASKKGKNKRPADEEPGNDSTLDAMVADSLKAADEPAKKMSKAEKKAANKKLKNNDGEAAAAPDAAASKDSADKKKVQFAKNLEQGPTPSKADAKKDNKKDDKKAASVSLGVKDVGGVSVDDRKIGSGPAAKKGSRVEMRYIGKLDNGKVFDSNKSGKPFAFKLGIGEVIKGWDVGLVGISSGGERRLVIPAHLAYGKSGVPGIPPNSKLTFDVKCLSVK